MTSEDLSRRAFIGAFGATVAATAARAEPPRSIVAEQDFDELWRTLGERYCFFAEKQTDWAAVRRLYRPQMAAAQSDQAVGEVVRRVLNEFYDAHTHRTDAGDGTPRWPYFDLWVERTEGGARIVDFREGSAAAQAGLSIGEVIAQVGGQAIDAAAAAQAPRCLRRPDPEAEAYALNVAVSGFRGQPRRLGVRRAGAIDLVELPLQAPQTDPVVSHQRLEAGRASFESRVSRARRPWGRLTRPWLTCAAHRA